MARMSESERSSSSGFTRRGFLGGAATGAVAASLAGTFADLARAEGQPGGGGAAPAAPRKMPVVFVGHGSPMTAIDPVRGGEWQKWSEGWTKPKAILVVSAHWEAAPAALGATQTVPLIYDFGGFPRALYEVKYAAPGAPALAQRVKGLMAARGGVRENARRGLDHGAWVPLVWMSRAADVPVLQLSLPAQDGPSLVAMGKALAPLRDEGVLILASGNLTHNLRAVDGRPNAPTPKWASDHDAWLADVLQRRDLDALTDFRRRAPALAQNHPTLEHLTPVLVAAGAASPAWSATTFPVTGWDAGSLSRRCAQLS
jgi:4,5-DOPA dioxygenase extradiol